MALRDKDVTGGNGYGKATVRDMGEGPTNGELYGSGKPVGKKET